MFFGRASKKDFLENMIAKKRAQELENLEKWQSRTEYLKNSSVRAMKEKLWTSNKCYDSSIQAFDMQNSSSESNLLDRRERLRSLISSEHEDHKELIETFASNLKGKRIDTIPVAVRKPCNLKSVDKLPTEHCGSIDQDNKRTTCNYAEFSLVQDLNKQTQLMCHNDGNDATEPGRRCTQ
ncbi:unnamed protein product [Dicrocoelium dendriticum]|nr:unnamed protein product [Dicrocoelium dendriticum]